NLYYKSVDGLLMSKDGKTVIACPIGNTSSPVIPDNVICIDDYAFFNCLRFTGSLIIPDSVETIGDYAFFGCSKFTESLIIGNSVKTIGDCAFCGCRGFIGSLVIPDSVETIGDYAFCNCSGFTDSLIIGDSVTTVGHDAFFDCSGFEGSLVLGNSIMTIGDYAFFGCCGFTGNVIIPDDVTIGDKAFFCYRLTCLVIPSSVKFETSSPFTGIFYAEDGTTKLEQTVDNLCGYTFANHHIDHYIVNDHDAEMIRQGSVCEYTVTYDVNGGSVSGPVQFTVVDMELFTVASYSGIRSGYLFGGWNDGTNTYAAGSVYAMGTTCVIFTAVWIEVTATTHNVTYNINGGSLVAPDQSLVVEGSTFAVASYLGIRVGYSFGGWNDGTNTYAPGSTYLMGTYDVTFNAVWIGYPSAHASFDDYVWTYVIMLVLIIIVLTSVAYYWVRR
ncbi:MAG: leucine-rich repeat protein, partial [Candidatus Methanomethylophilaceae archaeon]|nr:leucine-rich repeat protein [Candidatus Methanomethylophilaceae archaeon]